MAIMRTIFALVIAASVAMLPAVGGAGFTLKSAGLTNMSDMADADMADTDMADECCPHHTQPCKGMGGGRSMTDCALKCFNFSVSFASVMAVPQEHSGIVPPLTSLILPAQASIPPFRPPRV